MQESSLHLLSSSQELVGDLSQILEVSKAMSAIHDIDKLLLFIAESAIKLVDSDRGTIFLVDHATNELFCSVSDEEMKEIRFPVGVGIAGNVAETGVTINIADAYSDPRFNQEIDKKTGYKTYNLLTLPMKNRQDKPIGVLQMLNKAGGSYTEYDQAVMEAMASHAACAVETAQLLRHFADKQKIEAALSIAKEIQQNLLPKTNPEVEGYDIAGVSLSADETGGDYYDHFQLLDGRWCLLVGDVSGHGIGSALLMASTRAYLKALITRDSDMQTILGDINNLLEKDSSDEKFMTMFALVLDAKSHEYFYISAGHDEPLYWQAAKNAFLELDSTGLPLGIVADVPYDRSEAYVFETGDYLFISTDGIWEAPNATGDRFGKERLEAVLTKHQHQSAADMANEVVLAVKRFVGEEEQADDLTILIIKKGGA